MSAGAQPEIQEQTARDIAFQASRAMESGRPLFLIVYYEHEALKIAFLQTLRQALHSAGLGFATFDPVQRPEHGAGQLYPKLAATAATRSLALIAGIPRSDQAGSFLDYLNLHRDRIAREKLRLVLFLHTSEAERFMAGAGDLWDFRHHTYWLEGVGDAEQRVFGRGVAEKPTASALPEVEKEEIESHLKNVRVLIEQTSASEEKLGATRYRLLGPESQPL